MRWNRGSYFAFHNCPEVDALTMHTHLHLGAAPTRLSSDTHAQMIFYRIHYLYLIGEFFQPNEQLCTVNTNFHLLLFCYASSP